MKFDIEFTEEKLVAFKDAYARANAASEKTFKFEGHLFLTDYAKWVIVYLDTQFKR